MTVPHRKHSRSKRRWRGLLRNASCEKLADKIGESVPAAAVSTEDVALRRRKAKSDNHKPDVLVFATGEARADQAPTIQRGGSGSASDQRALPLLHLATLCLPRVDERPARQEVEDHRTNKSKALLETANQINAGRDHRDNELRNDDFRCFRTIAACDKRQPTAPARAEKSFSMQKPRRLRHRWLSRCLRHPRISTRGAAGGAASLEEPKRRIHTVGVRTTEVTPSMQM